MHNRLGFFGCFALRFFLCAAFCLDLDQFAAGGVEEASLAIFVDAEKVESHAPESGKPDHKFADVVSYAQGALLIDQYKLLDHFGVGDKDAPPDRLKRIDCSARLDYLGDGSAYVPSSAQSVDLSTASPGADPSSTDF